MKKFSVNQLLGIVLIICAVLLSVRLPNFLSSLKQIVPLAVAVIGFYYLLK